MFDTVICASYRRLDASIGASERHDLAVRTSAIRQRHYRVHRIPPRVDDVGQRPSVGRDNEGYRSDLGQASSKISVNQKLFSIGKKAEEAGGCRTKPLLPSKRVTVIRWARESGVRRRTSMVAGNPGLFAARGRVDEYVKIAIRSCIAARPRSEHGSLVTPWALIAGAISRSLARVCSSVISATSLMGEY